MTIILILLGIIIASFGLYMSIIWCADGRGWAKIKYKDFRKYYALNPNRWNCRQFSVIYTNYMSTFEEMREYFNFSFIDFCRYSLWQWKLAREESRKRNAESMQRMIDDINKTEAQNVSR